jgi:hypothetical protein
MIQHRYITDTCGRVSPSPDRTAIIHPDIYSMPS